MAKYLLESVLLHNLSYTE